MLVLASLSTMAREDSEHDYIPHELKALNQGELTRSLLSPPSTISSLYHLLPLPSPPSTLSSLYHLLPLPSPPSTISSLYHLLVYSLEPSLLISALPLTTFYSNFLPTVHSPLLPAPSRPFPPVLYIQVPTVTLTASSQLKSNTTLAQRHLEERLGDSNQKRQGSTPPRGAKPYTQGFS